MRTLVLAALAWLTPALSAAAELKVLTAGAFKPVLQALAPEFEQRTGHKLQIDNDTAGALQKRIAGGEVFDLVVLTVAPLPAEIQNYTVYAAALSARARDPAAAQALLATLAGPGAAAVLKAKGMEAP